MRRCVCSAGLLALVVLLAALATAAPASAAAASPPQWVISSASGPTNFAPAASGDQYVVTATNVGGEATSGPVTIADTLPANGVEATGVVDSPEGERGNGEAFTRGSLTCPSPPLKSPVSCSYAGAVAPGDTLRLTITVAVTAPEGAVLENTATVSGGGAASASTSADTTVSSEPASFGVANFFTAASTSQAGAHPNFTTSFTLNRSGAEEPVGNPRDVDVALPPGLTGNPLAVPRCNIDYVRRRLCPEDAAIGVATAHTNKTRFVVLVYNVTPYAEEPAAFAFSIDRGLATVRLDTSVVPNSAGEYVVHVSAAELNESEPVLESSVTLWGAPADYNGAGPDQAEVNANNEPVTFGGPGAEAALDRPFVRNPTACTGSPLPSKLETDSWQAPGPFGANETPDLSDPRWLTEESQIPSPGFAEGFGGCALLSSLFTPSIEVDPVTREAGAPSGYDVKLGVPQPESGEALSTPDLKDVTVTLPQGTVASPSAANGLEACSDAQFALPSTEAAACPQASQIGEAEITSPLLLKPLTGQVFLGEPECSPCGPAEAQTGKMVRLFLQAQGSGVRIKLEGRTEINQLTGQLTTVFPNNPQQPVGDVLLKLKEGPGAPLANPTGCGTATTTSQLTPWSGEPAAEPSSSFAVSFDGKGAGCPSPLAFGPSFDAQTETPAAGEYSPFRLTFARRDHEQDLAGITVQTPPGLLGMVSHVTPCQEPQANAGSCSGASQIGTATAGVGPGPDPYYVTGGRVYLTGPYNGGPYGLSVVVPAVAGPFNLGYEVVRAAIHIDPHTSALTVVSNPLPQMKDGIPFQLKTVDVEISRPQFIFNPTNCAGQSIGATINGSEGAAAAVTSPFAVGGCTRLPFKPSFTVSTEAGTSKANGASLKVQVAQQHGEANIHRVDVQLPLALPSRLTTIQKACTEAQFAAGPAGCPVGSQVGTAIAHTPVLNVPFTGTAYLVSHGGAAFPDLDVVLQAENITIDLVGNTDIKKGITYSRFETVPDAPISSFELNLPEGPHSALAANGNLCGQSLAMPTTIVGQSGAQVTQTTKISVVGCPKPTVSIKKARIKGSALLLSVATKPTAKVTISGRGLKTTKLTLAEGTHSVRIPMTKVGEADRRRHKRTRITIGAVSVAGSSTAKKTASVKL